ncbi:hypothetical protein H5410_029308 [Solanum commersonii]|uniref:Uncharacterized protein n=1 Tax=Solanum commersonii TaxID=4109 RepID=A0A9J5Z7A1_SOLCO|nr:hypothetical protein H5410_029308 [Solanum commersonii]
MAKTSHLQGQTNLGVDKPPILPIFVCYSPRDFTVTQNFDVISAKNLHKPPPRDFMVTQNIDVIFAEKLHEPPLRP